jgi:hypothetical protein
VFVSSFEWRHLHRTDGTWIVIHDSTQLTGSAACLVVYSSIGHLMSRDDADDEAMCGGSSADQLATTTLR